MQPLLGAHVSAAGGVLNALTNAERIGADVIQIFGASPRQWQAIACTEAVGKEFQKEKEKSRVQYVYLHAPYLPNLASTSVDTIKKSIKNLSVHLEIAKRLGAEGLVVHVGSGGQGRDIVQSIDTAAKGIQAVLKNVSGDTAFIIENAAGGGTKLGSQIWEIGAMIERVKSPRVKMCLDTAHAFEAGLIEGYTPKEIQSLCREIEKEVGLNRLVALHANDSKTPFQSCHDRHENIGQGHMGKATFKNLLAEPQLAHTHWILEVPGFDGSGPDRENMEILRALR